MTKEQKLGLIISAVNAFMAGDGNYFYHACYQ
jgi:hypothetical protein